MEHAQQKNVNAVSGALQNDMPNNREKRKLNPTSVHDVMQAVHVRWCVCGGVIRTPSSIMYRTPPIGAPKPAAIPVFDESHQKRGQI
jgi:hypothetical protein